MILLQQEQHKKNESQRENLKKQRQKMVRQDFLQHQLMKSRRQDFMNSRTLLDRQIAMKNASEYREDVLKSKNESRNKHMQALNQNIDAFNQKVLQKKMQKEADDQIGAEIINEAHKKEHQSNVLHFTKNKRYRDGLKQDLLFNMKKQAELNNLKKITNQMDLIMIQNNGLKEI
jgi:hypothetical protein